MLAFVVSQIAGLLRRILVAQAFGASTGLDAFIAANRVSETLFNLVAGGALGSAFIPTFTGLLAKDNKPRAWRLASAVINLVALVMSLLAALAAFFAPEVVRYALAPGFSSDPAQFELAVSLLRIQLISAVIFGISGLIMAILNSHQIFLVPALTPAMYQIGMIFGVIVLVPVMGIFGLAWGVVIGAAFHLLLQLPTLFKQNGAYHLELGLRNHDVREVIRLMLPRLLGVAVVQLNFWVNTWLASSMPVGSVTGIEYGFALMLMAQVAIAQSIATAAMPTLSTQYALNKLEDVRSSLTASLRGVLLLSVPAAIGLIILRVPLISMLYQRGEFDEKAVQLVAWALLWYAAGLVGHSVLEILARAFYALHDTRTPVLVGTIAMGLNVVLSISLAGLFRQAGWMPLGGLALANSLATTLEALTLLFLMHRRLNGLLAAQITGGLGQACLAAAGMGIALLAWNQTTADMKRWIIGLGGMGIGVFSYALCVWALRVPEIKSLFGAITRRLHKTP